MLFDSSSGDQKRPIRSENILQNKNIINNLAVGGFCQIVCSNN